MRDFLQSERDTRHDTQVRRIVYTMLRRLERERRTVTGPAQKPPDRQRHQILRSPKLQETIEHLAGEAPKNQVALRKRSLEMLRSMQAVPDAATIKALEVLLDRVARPARTSGEEEDRREAAELLHGLGTEEALRRLDERPGHARARALLRDARWQTAAE